MSIITQCHRVNLGHRVTSSALRKAASTQNTTHHLLVNRGGIYHLVSSEHSGIPLVEATLAHLNMKKPCLILSAVDEGYLISKVTGEKLASITDNLCRVLNRVAVTPLITAMLNLGGEIIIIDKAAQWEDIRPLDNRTYSPKYIETSALLALTSLQFTPLHKLSLPTPFYVKFIAVAAMVAVITAFFFTVKEDVEPVKVLVDPYLELKNALEKQGSAKAMSWQLYNDLNFAQYIHSQGWHIDAIKLNSQSSLITVGKSEDARLDQLMKITADSGRDLTLASGNKFLIYSPHKSVPTLDNAVLAPIEDLQQYISLALEDWLPHTRINFSEPQKKHNYFISTMTLTVADYLNDQFDVTGTILNHLPVSFTSATLTYTPETDNFSGTLTFNIYGCKTSNLSPNGCN